MTPKQAALVAQIANDVEQRLLFTKTGQTPVLWNSLSEGQQSDMIRTTQSEIGSPLTDAEWKAWIEADDGTAPGIPRRDHAPFQAVCIASRDTDWDSLED